MTKILIDTNIFLGLYHSNNDTLAIFEDIRKLIPYLIVSDQIFDEFLRNRDGNLQNLMINIKKAYTFNPHSSSLIKNLSQFERVPKIKKELEQSAKDITNELQNMLDHPEKDPIYSNFKKIFEYKRVTKLLRDDDIIEKAKKRKFIGNPPVSLDKNTIGDEILWELLISNIRDDLVILTRDETFKNHITFLMNEYNEKTGKKLFIEEKISNAMKRFGKDASPETIKFENSYKMADETVKAIISSARVNNPEAMKGIPVSSLAGINADIGSGFTTTWSNNLADAIAASAVSPLAGINADIGSGLATTWSNNLADAIAASAVSPLAGINTVLASGLATTWSNNLADAIAASAVSPLAGINTVLASGLATTWSNNLAAIAATNVTPLKKLEDVELNTVNTKTRRKS